ncbi:unnamed protein product [Schistocephalus solidus]|uniref:Uncharacterized protein n=1 Tax=Schistocephalus solidus TaxID=70667 RepID=A0A183TS64_SCHSO|nr:unnamed protein product [Schistocephalus solidus]
MQPQRKPQGKRPPGKLNTLLLNLLAQCFDLSNQITEKREDLQAPADNATLETGWCQLRNVIHSTALEVLGRARHQHKDWFDDNDADISNLLAEKNALHKAYVDLRTDATKAAFLRCRRLVQQRLREMQDAWMSRHPAKNTMLPESMSTVLNSKNVKTFAYLGSTLSHNKRIDNKVAQRISKASQVFGRLQASVWNLVFTRTPN